jgi:thiol-disulfide isomerase/thioredoxin
MSLCSSPRRCFSGFFIFLSLLSACVAKDTGHEANKDPKLPEIGSLVPDFKLQDRKGRFHKLSDFRGNIVFLNFWATWCPPCVEELPLLDSLNRRYSAKPFTMIAVSVDTNWQTVNTFFRDVKKTPSFLVLLDSSHKVAQDLYGTYKYPESYLIDAEGRLIKKFVGAYNWVSPDKFEEIDELFAKKTQ